MNKKQIEDERDRLAEWTALAIRNSKPYESPLPGTHNTCVQSFHAGFNAAVELMERERVKPLRYALDKIRQPNCYAHPQDARQDRIGTAERALAKVEEWL